MSSTHRCRRLLASALLLLSGAVLAAGTVPAVAATPTAPGVAVAAVRDGSTPETAAASCYEIHRNHPELPSGPYWLQTPRLGAPQRFYCDQESDGGGWVLLGRGRDSWDRYEQGQGDPDRLLTRGRSPGDFAAVQLPATTVQGLLDGAAVADLEDGLRLVRARDAAGTRWQDYTLHLGKMQDFSWSLLGADHPVTSATSTEGHAFTHQGLGQGIGLSESSSSYETVSSLINRTRGWEVGFAYGRNVAGSTSPTSYLYSSTSGYARPYAEIYARPRLLSADLGYAPIPDAGLPASTRPAVASSFAAPTSWGVTDRLLPTGGEGYTEVQAFAQVGNTMFVGGNFRHVRRGAADSPQPQVALAALDATTGEFVPTFRPVLDGQVKSLLGLPDGTLVVGGEFSTVNGNPHAGIVRLDATTGQVLPGWDLQLTNRLTGGIVSVRALGFDGTHLYMGGAFTHARGGGTEVYSRSVARVDLSGRPDRAWTPEMNGTVNALSLDADGGVVYVAGYFSAVGGAGANKAIGLSTLPGAAIATPAWKFTGSAPADYQQAIASVGSRVYTGGSEHLLFSYDDTTFERLSTTITDGGGGDVQAIAATPDVVYAGCHCDGFAYQDATRWRVPTGAFTEASKIQWLGAWDARTGRYLPGATPFKLESRNSGAWALTVARDGALWVGGDFVGSRTSATKRQWNGGFVRYPPRDAAAPATPTGLSSAGAGEGVTLTWAPVADATSYEILRGDRVVAATTSPSVTLTGAGAPRYFVRAVDGAGNRSATTPVHVPAAPPPLGEVAVSVLDGDTTWALRYGEGAPDPAWTTTGFDDSAWRRGRAPLGYGTTGLATTLTPPAQNRPLTAYFRTTVEIADPQSAASLDLEYVADDGALVRVNGIEVSRTRLGTGTVTDGTYADAAVRTPAPTRVLVPATALRPGANVITVETHLNYRASPSLSFRATATLSDEPSSLVLPPPEDVPSGPTPATDVVLAGGEDWIYHNTPGAVAQDWATGGELDWPSAPAPLGWGAPDLATAWAIPVADRPVTSYFVRDVTLDPAAADGRRLRLKVRADDAALVRVNGVEVGRAGLGAAGAPVSAGRFADTAVSAGAAIAAPLVVDVPSDVLRPGTNRIAVETHLNYRSAPSMSFALTAAWATSTP